MLPRRKIVGISAALTKFVHRPTTFVTLQEAKDIAVIVQIPINS